MTQLISPLKHRPIAMSMGKLQKATSQARFRIKSLRTKTIENQAQTKATEKDYEADLIDAGYTKQFLKSLYILKSNEAQLKISQMKYQAFIKALSKRLQNTKTLNVASLNFLQQSAQLFLSQFLKINKGFSTYDFSNCTFLRRQAFQDWIVNKCLKKDKRMNKLIVRNLSLSPQQIDKILYAVIENGRIYELDMSNQNSQTMNRFGQNIQVLLEFAKNNQTIAILKLDNLSLRRQGVQSLQKGIALNPLSPLKILSLKNNAITQNASLYCSLIARNGLVSLDLSENPLGPSFYLTSPSWKLSTVRNLDLSMTEMNAEALIYFMTRLQQNRFLMHLKLDKNDFSHHWFNQMKQVMINSSLESLSMVDCKIVRFTQMFTGLNFNKYLKKLNISLNQFDEGTKELADLVRLNKTLTDLRLKFCGLKPQNFTSFLKSLTDNTFLDYLDISQNYLGELGAHNLLKALNVNKTLNTLLCEKVQIPLRLKKDIDEKIHDNRTLKYQRQFKMLKKENVTVKEKDIYTWQDVTENEKMVKDNDKKLNKLQTKIAQLEKDYDRKRFRFYDFTRDWKKEEKQLDDEVETLEKKEKHLEAKEKRIQKQFNSKIEKTKQQTKTQEETIIMLQNLIRQQSLKVRKRQNQLQDFFQNSKYLNKKVQGNRGNSSSKLGFDNSTSLVSKSKKSDRIK